MQGETHIGIFVILLFIVVIFFSGIFYGKATSFEKESSSPESPWPMAHHDSMRTGRTNYKQFSNAGKILWKYHTGSSIMGGDGIVIDAFGNIYFYAQDHYLYSISDNGTFRWKYPVENTSYFIRGPVIVDNCVYFLNNPGIPPPLSNLSEPTYVYSVSYNGSLRYKMKIDYFGSPVVFGNSIYVGSKEGIYKINDGVIDLVFPVLKSSNTIAIDSSGNLYGAVNDTIYMVTPVGDLKWQYKMPNVVMDDLVIGDDGTVYAYVFEKGLYATSSDGNLKWSSSVSGPIKGTIPAVGNDGKLYLTTSEDPWVVVYALKSENGNVIWKTKIYGDESTSPVIGRDGNIYVGTWYTRNDTGYLYSITPDGNVKWRIKLDGGVITQPAVGDDGTIYVGTTNGTLYAIGGEKNSSGDGTAGRDITWHYYAAIGGGVVVAVAVMYYSARRKRQE